MDSPYASGSKRTIGSSSKSHSRKNQKQNGPEDEIVCRNEGKGGTQQSTNEVCRQELRDKACRKLAKWFYDAGIPCNAANYDSFTKMVEAVGQHGLGMKPPSVSELRGPLLNKAVDDIQKKVNEHKKEWAQNGCSILLDGWRDNVVQKDFVNFVVNSQKGSVFVKSMDISDVAKNANLLFLALDKLVDEVGEENVVQVVTDNSPAYDMAGKLLEVRRPHLYWTPCAAQCIELMLEDIGRQIAPVNNALRKGMFLNGYICNDVGLQNLMMMFTNQQNLHSPAITRFATSFVTLSQIHKQKDNLRKMINSEEWKSSKWTKERMGKKFQSYLLQESFWKNVDYCLKLTDPLVEVLRFVAGERKSAMGYIYHAMVRAKDLIAKGFPNMEKYYKKAFEIIDHRWDCQLNRPLHIAGYYLNPEYYYENVSDVSSEKVRKGLYSCIERLVPDLQIRDKITQELATYQNSERLFGRNVAIRQRKMMAPANWWALFGASAPNLQKFAMRVLSLNCSAISCGRNWGVIQDLHTKKRRSLAQATFNDMVYVKFNRALDRRHKRKEIDDPIILQEIDESNEWLMGKMDEDDDDGISLVDTPVISSRPFRKSSGIEDVDDEIEEEYIGVSDEEYDPLLLQEHEIDEDDEWLMGRMEDDSGDDDDELMFDDDAYDDYYDDGDDDDVGFI